MPTRALALIALFVFAGCGKDSNGPGTPTAPTPTVSAVAVTIANAILLNGSSEQATATVTMSNGTTQQMAGAWASDNSAVASVDSTGRVTGQGSGRTTIRFTASGVSGSRDVRGVPNYQGQWSGSYFITGCSHSGAFASINFCGEFSNGQVLPMNMTLTQGSRDSVEGRTFLGSLQSDSVSGPIENDGAVQFSGIIRSGSTSIDVFWRFNALQPGRMVGGLRQTWRLAGFSGQGELSGEFRDMNKSSSASTPFGAPAVVPRTLQETVRAVAGGSVR